MDVVSDAISAVRIGRPSSDRVRLGGSWAVRVEAYEGAGFHVVLEGSCWLLPDSGDPVSLGAGDAVLIPHGTGHVLADGPLDAAAVARAEPVEGWNGTGWRGAGEGPAGSAAAPVPGSAPGSVPGSVPAARGVAEMLCGKYRLDRSRLHPLMAELPQTVHLPNRVGSHPELRAAIDLLGGELEAGAPGSSIAVPNLVDLLLVYMIRACMNEGANGSWPAALSDPVTAAALRALHADPAAQWSSERLAAVAGVSRPTLARRFTARVGRPPMAYLTWWRLTRAAALLRDTEESLAVIAARVGYGTPYAFSHAFSREFGTTPGRYRASAPASAPDAAARRNAPTAQRNAAT